MISERDISIIIHGEIRTELSGLFNFLSNSFREAEIFHVVYERQANLFENKPRLNLTQLIIPEPDPSPEFGWHTRNYSRHSTSAYAGIQNASRKYALKIRADLVPKWIGLPSDHEFTRVDKRFFHFNFSAHKLFVYPYYKTETSYFYGDMIVFGLAESLELLFNPRAQIRLDQLSTLREPIASANCTYITPEELLYMSYIKNCFEQDFDANDLICNGDFLNSRELICRLNCDIIPPEVFSRYFKSKKGRLFYKYMRNGSYKAILKLIRCITR